MKHMINLVACVVAIFLLSYILPNQISIASYPALLAAGLLLWLVNTFIQPVLKILSLPVTILTLGLFSLVISASMVMLTDSLIAGVSFGGFWPSLILALTVSVLQVVLNKIFEE